MNAFRITFTHNRYLVPVWIARFARLRSTLFLFFSAWTVKSHEFIVQRQKSLFMNCSSTFHTFKNIKNGSHDTIHIFKNYFATVFSVFSFNNNKFNLNWPLIDCENWNNEFIASGTFRRCNRFWNSVLVQLISDQIIKEE